MKLGKLIDTAVTAEEAAKLGGLDFDVELQPVLRRNRDGEIVESPTRRHVVRLDTDDEFEIVSDEYGVCQYQIGRAHV